MYAIGFFDLLFQVFHLAIFVVSLYALIEAARPKWLLPMPRGTFRVSSCFAPRWGSFHYGLDMAAPGGTPFHAAGDGVVVEAGPMGGYGNVIMIEHADGTITWPLRLPRKPRLLRKRPPPTRTSKTSKSRILRCCPQRRITDRMAAHPVSRRPVGPYTT